MKDEGGDRMTKEHGAEFSEERQFIWETVETPIVISWSEEKKSDAPSRVSFQTEIRLSWIDVLRHLPIEPKKSWNRISLLRVFSNSMAGTFRDVIERRGFAKIARLRGQMDAGVFDKILDALVKQGILEVVARPKYVTQKGEYWQVTDMGVKWIRKAREGRGGEKSRNDKGTK